MKKIFISIFISCIFYSLHGQSFLTVPEDTTKAKELEAAVVTGQYKPRSVKNSVYQVRVIGKERIQKQGATKLQDVLNSELNIRFSQDLATGGSDITMMGLKGQNVKILLDGLPLVGRQGTTNEININQIDINSIERIEIVEGPMSVIYGADALAGVINIITKKQAAAKFSVTARVQEETVGNEYGWEQGVHNQYAGLGWRNKKWEAGGSFGHNYFGGWKDTAIGREMVWHWKDQLIATGYIGYNNATFNIRYRIDGLDEIITNPGNFTQWQQDAGDSTAQDQEYLSRRIMQQLQASYFINSNLSLQAQAAYTNYSRQVFSTILSQHTGKLSMDIEKNQSLVKIKGFTFRSSAVYRISSLVSVQPGVDIDLESGEGERLRKGSNEVNDYAIFTTAEITPSAKWNIRPGIRFIKNSVYDAPPFIPSINTKYSLSEKLDLRLAYARGFRSPSLRELYMNFFDANHQIMGNPNLKAETSNSFTASLSWKKMSPDKVIYTSVLGGFYNSVKNLIDYALSSSDPNLYILTNVSNSKTAGINLTTTVKYNKWNVSLGASYTGFYNDHSEQDNSLPVLQWSAEANTNIGYTFSKIGLDANLFYKFTGKQPSYVLQGSAIVLTELEGYHMADITFNKRFSKTFFKYFTLSAGIRDLFDVDRVSSTISSTGGIHTNGAGRNLAYGRSYFAGLLFNWEKK
ncbi:MAG TPA: TonB-dependent receptor [Chitinophagaceae bacterium]|nr:TonB-dependent receptor [Chitinophagaceae bacterium]